MKKNLILIILIIMPTLSYAENKNYFFSISFQQL